MMMAEHNFFMNEDSSSGGVGNKKTLLSENLITFNE